MEASFTSCGSRPNKSPLPIGQISRRQFELAPLLGKSNNGSHTIDNVLASRLHQIIAEIAWDGIARWACACLSGPTTYAVELRCSSWQEIECPGHALPAPHYANLRRMRGVSHHTSSPGDWGGNSS